MKEEELILRIYKVLRMVKTIRAIGEIRFDHIRYVIGLNRDKVICAFELIKWNIVEVRKETRRINFEGVEVNYKIVSMLPT
jgi:hypothetical protein